MSFNFTRFHPRQMNQLENNYSYSRSQANFNNKLNSFPSNNFNFNVSKIISSDQDTSSFNNNINNNYYPNNNYYRNNYIYDENNEYLPCFILVTNLDEYSKERFFNFMENERINARDVKVLDKYKLIIKFLDEKTRNDFMENYSNVKQDFIGVEIRYINEEEKDRIINNNANKVAHNNSYFNNYMNETRNMIQMPKKKTNFQKFIDVFLNL